MIKLTAEKARERIEHLQNWQDQRGLTLREEEYLQALEMALVVLKGEIIREGADGSVWSEITEEEYQRIKKEWFSRTVVVLEKAE